MMSTIIELLCVPLQSDGGGTSGVVVSLLSLVVTIVVIAGTWKAFQKADRPGWAAIIPIYNTYVMIKIGGNAWWWLLLLFVPLVNFLALIKISIDVARAFGRGIGFGLGLSFFSFIFWPLLGFGDYEYQGVPE